MRYVFRVAYLILLVDLLFDIYNRQTTFLIKSSLMGTIKKAFN